MPSLANYKPVGTAEKKRLDATGEGPEMAQCGLGSADPCAQAEILRVRGWDTDIFNKQ